MKKKILDHAYNGFYVQKYKPPSKNVMSKDLASFLATWLYKAQNGRYYIDTDYGRKGLCQSLITYLHDYGDHEAALIADDYVKELRALFVEDGLDEAFPFNDGDINKFLQESNMFANKERIKWVMDRVERYKRETGMNPQ